jgi:hypothetical protein
VFQRGEMSSLLVQRVNERLDRTRSSEQAGRLCEASGWRSCSEQVEGHVWLSRVFVCVRNMRCPVGACQRSVRAGMRLQAERVAGERWGRRACARGGASGEGAIDMDPPVTDDAVSGTGERGEKLRSSPCT